MISSKRLKGLELSQDIPQLCLFLVSPASLLPLLLLEASYAERSLSMRDGFNALGVDTNPALPAFVAPPVPGLKLLWLYPKLWLTMLKISFKVRKLMLLCRSVSRQVLSLSSTTLSILQNLLRVFFPSSLILWISFATNVAMVPVIVTAITYMYVTLP